MSELKYIFGPVPSRRLGRSLGINVVPEKICSLDCLYCEIGKTNALTLKRAPYYKAEHIIKEFSSNIDKFNGMFDVITVTGAGEPTLNSELNLILEGIKNHTDKPVALLTNATTLDNEDVYNTMLNFDIVVPSLDGVNDEDFSKINKPEKSIKTADIINNLIRFSNEYKEHLYLEILFCKNVNDSKEHIEQFKKILPQIRAEKVQLGTIHRPPAYSNTEKVSPDFLLNTAREFIKSGIPAEVTSGFHQVYENAKSLNLHDLIPALLIMRPCTIEDMCGIFGKNINEINEAVDFLMKNKIIDTKNFDNEIYYIYKKAD